MAFEITVEVDYRLNRDEIVGALQKSGATNIHQEGQYLLAFFSTAELSFWYIEKNPPRPIITEGARERNWMIGAELTFRYTASKSHEGNIMLHKFLESLAGCTDAWFVAAIDFDKLVAIRDDKGLRFVM